MNENEQKVRISNRRSSARLFVDLTLAYKIEDVENSEAQEIHQGEMLDFSEGGMKFTSRCRLWPEANLLFTLKDRAGRLVISGTAKVLGTSGEQGAQNVRAQFSEIILHKVV